jgi:hypothetical protein
MSGTITKVVKKRYLLEFIANNDIDTTEGLSEPPIIIFERLKPFIIGIMQTILSIFLQIEE